MVQTVAQAQGVSLNLESDNIINIQQSKFNISVNSTTYGVNRDIKLTLLDNYLWGKTLHPNWTTPYIILLYQSAPTLISMHTGHFHAEAAMVGAGMSHLLVTCTNAAEGGYIFDPVSLCVFRFIIKATLEKLHMDIYETCCERSLSQYYISFEFDIEGTL